jgi:hypothetical protein
LLGLLAKKNRNSMTGEYPRWKTCTVCRNEYHREKECWNCPKPEQQKVRGKPDMIGSEPWGHITQKEAMTA